MLDEAAGHPEQAHLPLGHLGRDRLKRTRLALLRCPSRSNDRVSLDQCQEGRRLNRAAAKSRLFQLSSRRNGWDASGHPINFLAFYPFILRIRNSPKKFSDPLISNLLASVEAPPHSSRARENCFDHPRLLLLYSSFRKVGLWKRNL